MSSKYNSRKKIGFIGMRVFKTVIAVYLCFIYGLLRKASPLYAVIAALISMQTDPRDGLNVGKHRVLGTIVGGVFGLATIIIIRLFNFQIYGHTHYLLLSLILIPIIYTNVYILSPASTTISCVVFLSIAVSHIQDLSPVLFTLNRTIDTSIGVIISVLVNKLL